MSTEKSMVTHGLHVRDVNKPVSVGRVDDEQDVDRGSQTGPEETESLACSQ